MFQITFLLSCLLPYVAPPVLRFPAQTQPWAALLGWTYVMIRAYEMPKWKVSLFDAALGVLTAFMMMYVYTHQHVDFLFYLKKSAVFLFSISIIFYGRKISPRALWASLLIAISIYVFVGLLQIFANSVYQKVALPFVPLQNIVIGKRGVASLCPEATDFGLLATFMLFFVLLLRKIQHPPTSQRNIMILAALAGLCVLSTASGSGIFASVFMITAMYAPNIRNIRAILIGIGVSVAGLVLLVVWQPVWLMNVRGVQLLITLLTSPAALIATTTFSYRFINNLVGLIGFFNSYGLGYGAGAYIFIAPQIYTHYGLGIVWQLESWYYQNVYHNLGVDSGGVFPMLMLEYGVFGAALVLLLYQAVYRSKLPYKWAALVLLTVAWAQSFPVAWPPFWLLVGLAMNPHFVQSVRSRVRTIEASSAANPIPA